MTHLDDDFCVVGIGASAGGLEALEDFFRSADVTVPMAYIVIQHVSPGFQERDGSVASASDAVTDSHYRGRASTFVPTTFTSCRRRKEVIISQRKLLLTDRPTEQLTFPIDHFLRSLAQDCGRRSVAVILSGTGTDGKRGVVDVHNSGGLVVTQRDPRFNGMPNAARETGVVDAELSADTIPGASGPPHPRIDPEVAARICQAGGGEWTDRTNSDAAERTVRDRFFRLPNIDDHAATGTSNLALRRRRPGALRRTGL